MFNRHLARRLAPFAVLLLCGAAGAQDASDLPPAFDGQGHIYGEPLMTEQEQIEYRRQVRKLEGPQLAEFIRQHRANMSDRAHSLGWGGMDHVQELSEAGDLRECYGADCGEKKKKKRKKSAHDYLHY
ncbi:MAG: hypothetical protein SV108_03420 [Pseudomonadota bacterium]|jgi:hypothetical protein|nr:hypothetical protein [Pseudomonadota bacterium]